MNKTIFVSLAILTLSTSVALAATRTHHSRAMKPNAPAAAAVNPNPYSGPMNTNAFARMGPSPAFAPMGMNSGDRDLYIRNQRDSGWDRKKDFNPNGTIRTQ
jgi:hypothetical protein